jgi:hypothetical protein
MAFQNSNAVTITGGTLSGVAITASTFAGTVAITGGSISGTTISGATIFASAITGPIQITAVGVAPLTVRGADVTTGIVIGAYSAISNAPALIHFSDAFTYNLSVGASSNGSFILTNGYPGVVGTIFFSVSHLTGNTTISGTLTIQSAVTIQTGGLTIQTGGLAIQTSGIYIASGGINIVNGTFSANVNNASAFPWIFSQANLTVGASFGMLIQASTNSADIAFLVQNAGTPKRNLFYVAGDGQIVVGDQVTCTAIVATGGATTANRFGPFITITSYLVNNGWISENLFFDGANWTYRGTGLGSVIYFSGGGVVIYTAPTGSPGQVANMTPKLGVSNDGVLTYHQTATMRHHSLLLNTTYAASSDGFVVGYATVPANTAANLYISSGPSPSFSPTDVKCISDTPLGLPAHSHNVFSPIRKGDFFAITAVGFSAGLIWWTPMGSGGF